MKNETTPYIPVFGKWVPIEEQLPEIGIDTDYPYASKMILLSDGEHVYYGQFENSPDFGETFMDDDGNNWADEQIKITHWMPKPPPPAKEIYKTQQYEKF